MDESQIDKLGSKMRNVYADVATEAPVPPEAAAKRPSRRLRKNRTFAGAAVRKANPASRMVTVSLVTQHPVTSLLVAVGVGYLLGRLSTPSLE